MTTKIDPPYFFFDGLIVAMTEADTEEFAYTIAEGDQGRPGILTTYPPGSQLTVRAGYDYYSCPQCWQCLFSISRAPSVQRILRSGIDPFLKVKCPNCGYRTDYRYRNEGVPDITIMEGEI